MSTYANSFLTPSELAVCQATGITQEELLKAKAMESQRSQYPGQALGLTKEEGAVCREMGLSPEEFLRAKSSNA